MSEIIQIDRQNCIIKALICNAYNYFNSHITGMPKGGNVGYGQEEKDIKTLAKYKRKKEENIFKMIPIANVYYREAVIVNFQSKKVLTSCSSFEQNESSKCHIDEIVKETFEQKSTIPKFNFDSKDYTPCFTVPADDKQYTDKQFYDDHRKKSSESLKHTSLENILVAKPKSKNNYCAVCRGNYEDYWNHIIDYSHKKNIRKSKFNNDIDYLTILIKQRIQNNEKDGVMTRSAKRKLDFNGGDYFQLEMNGSKKRKNDSINTKPSSKLFQQKDDECGEGQTPFTKKWYQTTAKSIYSALD